MQTKVGIRDFRENLSGYLESKTPVAITRHGATIGIYVPTKAKPSQADLEALRIAGEKMQELIAAAGTTEEELMEDVQACIQDHVTELAHILELSVENRPSQP
jgi:antitoxin (DNA-binding transcriptional repressor) of toxin-antitoxin stability system